ncbi:Uncharacterised protein [Vibrio cholerae]|nr:Uncharacterised protein [Vibrio cholerae]
MVFTKLHHLHAVDRHFCGFTQHVEQTDAQMASKTFIDKLQSRHSTPDDTILGRKIKIRGTGARFG